MSAVDSSQPDGHDDRWRLLDTDGNEVAVAAVPHELWPSDISHATIWALRTRDKLGLAAAVLENTARGHRRLLNLPHHWPPGALHAPMGRPG